MNNLKANSPQKHTYKGKLFIENIQRLLKNKNGIHRNQD